MKKMTVITLALTCMVCLASSTADAAIQAGDVIKLDFSTAGDGDGGSLADWNQTNNGSAAINTVIRHGDGMTIGGATITFSGPGVGGGFNNDPASNGWIGEAADPYLVAGANDIFFGPNAITTVFNGLDSNLLYNVRVYSLIGNNQGFSDTFTVDVGPASVTNTRGTRWNAATLEAGGTVFTGLQVNNANAIEVTVQGASNAFYPLNAIVVEAYVPEPASIAIWSCLALAFAGAGFYRARRKK